MPDASAAREPELEHRVLAGFGLRPPLGKMVAIDEGYGHAAHVRCLGIVQVGRSYQNELEAISSIAVPFEINRTVSCIFPYPGRSACQSPARDSSCANASAGAAGWAALVEAGCAALIEAKARRRAARTRAS